MAEYGFTLTEYRKLCKMTSTVSYFLCLMQRCQILDNVSLEFMEMLWNYFNWTRFLCNGWSNLSKWFFFILSNRTLRTDIIKINSWNWNWFYQQFRKLFSKCSLSSIVMQLKTFFLLILSIYWNFFSIFLFVFKKYSLSSTQC